MADIIDLFEYRKAQDTRITLRAAFAKSANRLYVMDVGRLVDGVREMRGWDMPDQSTIATPTGRAAFAVNNAAEMAPEIVSEFPKLDEHMVALQIGDKLEKLAARFFQYMEGGVSWDYLRGEWPKAVDGMVNEVTEAVLPSLHKINRNGAPDLRNG